ncbi:hypothetical protein WA026_007635 [Henosepilachna vigintioctopunctata]|uniref:Uncharacterized protein n=1 Tax=Henosepilachna vigintioctopunctata TaxID=420089 RepID=A0AAW1U550_9CUCU
MGICYGKFTPMEENRHLLFDGGGWRSEKLLERIDVASGFPNALANQLVLRGLGSSDLHSSFTCQASNNNMSLLLQSTTKIEMHYSEHQLDSNACNFYVLSPQQNVVTPLTEAFLARDRTLEINRPNDEVTYAELALVRPSTLDTKNDLNKFGSLRRRMTKQFTHK